MNKKIVFINGKTYVYTDAGLFMVLNASESLKDALQLENDIEKIDNDIEKLSEEISKRDFGTMSLNEIKKSIRKENKSMFCLIRTFTSVATLVFLIPIITNPATISIATIVAILGFIHVTPISEVVLAYIEKQNYEEKISDIDFLKRKKMQLEYYLSEMEKYEKEEVKDLETIELETYNHSYSYIKILDDDIEEYRPLTRKLKR